VDKVLIKGLRVFSYVGVNPEEKENGQVFLIDLELWANLQAAGQSDRLEDTVNYAAAAKVAARVLKEKKVDLVERAAQRITEELFLVFPKVERIIITLKKPHPPMEGTFDYVGVTLDRERGAL